MDYISITQKQHKKLCDLFELEYQPIEFEPVPYDGRVQPEPWNKGMKFEFNPKSESHKESMRKAWIKRKQEGKTIQEKTYIASLKKRRELSKRYDFIHDSGIIEYNLTVIELTQKYLDQNLHPSNLRKAVGCGVKGYIKFKGWRILTGEPEYFKPRKIDKRTLKKIMNKGD